MNNNTHDSLRSESSSSSASKERRQLETTTRFSCSSILSEEPDLSLLSSTLAPTVKSNLEALHNVLQTSISARTLERDESEDDTDDDSDDLSAEIKKLSLVEDNLREELELAGMWEHEEETWKREGYESFKFQNFQNFKTADSWKADLEATLKEMEEFPEDVSLSDEIRFEDGDGDGEHQLKNEPMAFNFSTSPPPPCERLKDYGIKHYHSDNSLPTIPLPVPSLPSSPPNFIPILSQCHREYLIFPPPNLFVGYNPTSDDTVRYAYLKIRPDVLCGAVMDAVSHAVSNRNGELIKRQGGHLRALFRDSMGLDTQLCLKRTTMERILLIQIFALESSSSSSSSSTTQQDHGHNHNHKEEDVIIPATKFYLQQSSHHKAEDKLSLGDILSSPIKLLSPMSSQTKNKHKTEEDEYPCLKENVLGVVRKGYAVISEIIDELETRDLAYCTLATTPFGTFPSLPTLDVQYCSQLRVLSREIMIQSLLQSASELEAFARESERDAILLITLLKPKYKEYGLAIPEFPKLIPLNVYPLEFCPPEVSFPPWGQKVMSKMEQISSRSPTSPTTPFLPNQKPILKGFSDAKKYIHQIFIEFQAQDDEEQSARLGRKNVQVMDRLGKCGGWKRDCIEMLSAAYGSNPTATKSAEEFRKLCLPLTSNPLPPSSCVPLFHTPVIISSTQTTPGICIVTLRQIYISTLTYGISWLWKPKARCFLFNLLDVSISLREDEIVIWLNNGGGEVVSFSVTEMNAKSWRELVELVRDVLTKREKGMITSKGGLVYVMEETKEKKK